MNKLIKLNETKINDELVQAVNARELHAFLESKEYCGVRHNDER